MSSPQNDVSGFADLGLSPAVLEAVAQTGYTQPTPVQAQTIPHLLEGRDVLGQAQTGTGKTAAFVLPLLSRLEPSRDGKPRIVVLAPTRELALQVSRAFETYGRGFGNLRVAAIYGGADYRPQLRALRDGVDVVVGTPGRMIDHLDRGSLQLDAIDVVVLDEADELLRMGFVEDIETILQYTSSERQLALFSATMPPAVRRIADHHLRDPEHITIKAQTATADTVRQRFCVVPEREKAQALAQVLECEDFDGAIIFVRTKEGTVRVAEDLQRLKYRCAALNGDVPQSQRERVVAQLKEKRIDIVVATDVAARGLDVERISHVINFHMPHDAESYVHRIGRTGRAGRQGDAVLFVTPAERRRLGFIERHTRQRVEPYTFLGVDELNARRVERFKERLTTALEAPGRELFEEIVSDYQSTHNVSAQKLAGALARALHGSESLLLEAREVRNTRFARDTEPNPRRNARPARHDDRSQGDTVRYIVRVGARHGAQPRHLVGAIANETGLSGRDIGRVEIGPTSSTVDLPADLPRDILHALKDVWVANRQLDLMPATGRSEAPERQGGRSAPARRRPAPSGRPSRKPAGKPMGKPARPGRKPARKATAKATAARPKTARARAGRPRRAKL